MAAVDDAETIRRFLMQMKGQHEPEPEAETEAKPKLANGHNSTNTTLHTHDNDKDNDISEYNKSSGTTTPPPSTVASQHHQHLTSPEAHPKPSPHLSGLKAPQNTPKTAASSPRLTAINTHNQDVADAFSDYVNNMEGRPLSESMWAPASARHKSSLLAGPRSARLFTPIKAVVPNPAINDNFDRMTFKAADPDHNVDKNLIGDHVTRSLFSDAPPSSVIELSTLADKIHKDAANHDQVKPEAANDEGLESLAHTKSVDKGQVEQGGAVSEDTSNSAHINQVGKENNAPSTSQAYLPPHLRVIRGFSRTTDSNTRVPGQDLSQSSPSNSSQTDASVEQKPASSESTVKTETDSPGTIEVGLKNATDPAGAMPLTGTSFADEDLENKTFFGTWPKGEERSRPAAKIRKVVIKGLPHGSTATFVASLIYGGSIEEIHVRPSAAGDLSAVIRFMDAGDCMKFYNETSNGLVYKKDAKGREFVLFVELSKDVDVVGGLLQGWILSGVTRCVRAVGVETHWGMDALLRIAERNNRKVEKIVDGYNPGGARSVVFRFCKVDDAVQFKAALSRDEEWEHYNIHYAADPCATATGVHLEE